MSCPLTKQLLCYNLASNCEVRQTRPLHNDVTIDAIARASQQTVSSELWLKLQAEISWLVQPHVSQLVVNDTQSDSIQYLNFAKK